MKLNLHILREDLKPMLVGSNLVSDKTMLTCSGVRPYIKNEPLRQGSIYVAEAASLPIAPDLEGTPSLISIGEPPESYKGDAVDLLVVNESLNLLEVMGKVAEMFERYDEWDSALRDIVLSRGNPEELGMVSQPLFENPLYCQGAGFKVIFLCVGDVDQLSQGHKDYLSTILGNYEFRPGEKLPEHTIVRLFSIKRYIDADTIKGLDLYSNHDSNTRAWCYNIGSDQAHFGRILNFEMFRELTDRDAALLNHLAPYVERLLRDTSLETAFDTDSMYSCARDMLSNVTVAPTTLEFALKEMRWDIDDEYFCMFLDATGEAVSPLELQTMAALIDSQLPENYHIVFDDSLIYIFNTSKLRLSHDEVVASVMPVFRDMLLRAGSSNPFRGLDKLYYYYLQAKDAYSYGKRKTPDFWHFRFEDYSFDILLDRCLAGRPPDTLRPQGLIRLDEYDKQHGSNLSKLLYLYLMNHLSVTETARAAFSSRSTCIRHLQQIREISQLDLDDARIRVELAISFFAETVSSQ